MAMRDLISEHEIALTALISVFSFLFLLFFTYADDSPFARTVCEIALFFSLLFLFLTWGAKTFWTIPNGPKDETSSENSRA